MHEGRKLAMANGHTIRYGATSANWEVHVLGSSHKDERGVCDVT